MLESDLKNRRAFLKVSAAGAMGLAACSLTGTNEETSPDPIYADDIQINPGIHNLRVAMAKNAAMVDGGNPATWDFKAVNNHINKSAVHANLDAMAKYLAQESSAGRAWAKIFRKPAEKAWADVRAAFKVNCIETKQMPKLAIVEKLCLELNGLGVPYANMVIWDGCHNADGNEKYSPFKGGNGIPAGVAVSSGNKLLGGKASTRVPAPWNGEADCTADIANGAIDILVNLPVNKGHGGDRGKVTLSMKNHFGTFDPGHGHVDDSEKHFNYLIGINRSSAIVGGDPPRQQLIVLDSIFAMSHGPTGGPPNHAPHVLMMGTFGPAVDYATAKLIREKEMACRHSKYLEQFLPAFGYTEKERDDFIAKSPEENGGKGVGLVSG